MGTRLEAITLDNGFTVNWRDFTDGTYVALNGIYLTEIGKGHVSGELEVAPQMLNPNKILHGGVIVTLADTIAIFGCGYLYQATAVATISLTVSYLKAVRSGKIVAKGKVLSQGKSISMWQVDINDESGNLCALVNISFSIGN
jgi:uncharacterized protein (TIGR00369 family)